MYFKYETLIVYDLMIYLTNMLNSVMKGLNIPKIPIQFIFNNPRSSIKSGSAPNPKILPYGDGVGFATISWKFM